MMAEEPTRSTRFLLPTDPSPWPWPWPPWGPWPTFPYDGAPWFLASAGDLHGRFVRRSWKDAKAVQGDRRAVMGAALKELEHRGVLPASEAERLTQITDALFDGGDALETARQVNQLLVDEEAGALARSIASIAEDSLQRGTQGLPRAGVPAAKVATEDVHGALGGALLGFEIGGPWGALFGGVIGAAAASAAEAFT